MSIEERTLFSISINVEKILQSDYGKAVCKSVKHKAPHRAGALNYKLTALVCNSDQI